MLQQGGPILSKVVVALIILTPGGLGVQLMIFSSKPSPKIPNPQRSLPLKILSGPLRAKKKLSPNVGLLYSKRPARPHDSNEANGKLIRVQGAQISSKTCLNQPNQTKTSNFSRFWMISQPPEIRLIYRLLRWNRVAQLIILNVINQHFVTLYYDLKDWTWIT